LVAFLASTQILAVALADEGGRHRRRERHSHREHEHSRNEFGTIDNPLYREQCGACHFAYPPGLLSAGSWSKILGQLENHNGAEVALDAQAEEAIGRYLEANAADRLTSKRAGRITSSLRGQTPTRITEVPYILNEHKDLPPETFKRTSVVSFSNCIACHPGAEQGVFDDDSVRIPD